MRYDFGEDMYVGLVSSCSNTLPTKKYECIPCNYSSDTDSPGVLGGWRKECVREKERRERERERVKVYGGIIQQTQKRRGLSH